MPVINGVYLKDFTALPSSVTDANIIPIAITGDQVAYRTTVAGIVTDARITSKLLTGLSVTGSTILATDTILQAFGKVQNQLNGKVTSVGLTMPSAFSVANSPITSAGTLAVTAAGVASQYIRGDGALADFPTTGGGGSSVSYYLNGSVSQGTFVGNTYYEMNKTPVIGTGTDFTIGADGYIAQFITDANDPASLLIPGGNWNVEMYFSASSNGGTPSFYVEVYKYDGTTFTLLGSSSATPEGITNGTAIDIYYTSVGIPETVLTLTDRLAIRVYVTHSGRTITLHTEDNHLSEIVTTFSNGLTTLNGLTKQAQYFAVGSTGTDFAIVSSVDTHTFNIPDASATARGLITTGAQTIAGDKTFTDVIKPNASTGLVIFSNLVTTNLIYQAFQNTGGQMKFGISSSAGSAIFSNESAYATVFGSGNATSLQFATNNIVRATFASGGDLLLTGGLTGTTANFTGQLTLGSTITNGTYTYTLPSATGTLALTSALSDYVPYTGATGDVDLGTNNGITLTDTSTNVSISITSSSIGNGAIYVDKSGAGTGIRVDNNGTGFGFYANNISTGYGITIGNASTGKGLYIDNAAAATGDPFVYTLGGAAFVKAKIDYLGNITGVAGTFTGQLSLGSTITNGTYTYTLPSATGTLALTSALSSYLPLSGGTLTGALNGTSATFSGGITASAGTVTLTSAANVYMPTVVREGTTGNAFFQYSTDTRFINLNGAGKIAFRNNANSSDLLTISDAGAATFSGNLSCSGAAIQLNQTELISSAGASNRAYAFNLGNVAAGDFSISQGSSATGGTYTTRLIISPTGAVTINNLGTGTVQATAGVLSVISDSKAKDKTGLFVGSALNAINKIEKPQYWNYNAKSGLGESTYSVKQFGLFADDIHEVLGEEFAPTQTQSVYDEETKETKVEPILIDGSISYSMSDRALLSLAIQAIQELKAEIDLLKSIN